MKAVESEKQCGLAGSRPRKPDGAIQRLAA